MDTNKILLFIVKAGLVLLMPLMSSCDDDFAPLKENDRYNFSIYGYLDLEADTQWIRVMPIRETIYYSTDPIDAIVTLTNLNSGQSVLMNDSLFVLDLVGTDNDIAFWNFWTDVRIEPNTEYEIRAVCSDDKASSVRFSTPDSFPTPALDIDVGTGYEYVLVSDEVENIVDVRTFWKIYNPEKRDTIIYQFNHTNRMWIDNNGKYNVQLSKQLDHEIIERRNPTEGLRIRYIKGQIFITSAGDEWINFPEMDKELIALPEATTNINDGLGYVVGAAIKIIPYDACFDPPESSNLVPCPAEHPMWKH